MPADYGYLRYAAAPMNPTRGSYTIGSEDIGAWMKYWREHDPRRKRISRFFRATGYLGAFYLAGVVASNQSSRTSAIASFVFVCVLLVGIMHAAKLGRRDWARLARRFMPEESSPAIYGAHELFLDESGIRIENSLGTNELRWAAIVRVGETDSHLFLYISPNQAIVIPAASLIGPTVEELSTSIRSLALAAA